MLNQLEVRIESVNLSDPQDIYALVQAANDMQGATEANFAQMRDKKWFKRLWEIITFSKDNQKVMAKNVASLAKMQDIVVRALLMASKDENEIAGYLTKNAEQLRAIAALQPKLTKAIDKIVYEHDPRPDIRDMSVEHRYVIVSAIWKFVDMSCNDNVDGLAQEYLRNLQKCCGPALNPEAETFDCIKINNLDSDGHRLLVTILCEVAALLADTPKKDAAFDEIRGYVDISPRTFNDINDKVITTAKLLGGEFIASFFANISMDEDMFVFNAEDLEFDEVADEYNAADDHEANESFTGLRSDDNAAQYSADDYAPKENFAGLPPDDTDTKFPALRETILKYTPSICKEGKYTTSMEAITSFINKHTLGVVKETAVALVDATIFGREKSGFLFTTHALYYRESGALATQFKVSYCDIDYENCRLNYNKKGKLSGLEIAIKGTSPITVEDHIWINHNALLDMITEIGKLSEYAPTDAPQPIAEMDYSVKLPFVKYLINFLNRSEKPCIEVMRFACDIGFTNEQLAELAEYATNPTESDTSILLQLNNNAPYGSRKSLEYALLIDMYSQLYLVTGTFHEEVIGYPFYGYDYFNETAKHVVLRD